MLHSYRGMAPVSLQGSFHGSYLGRDLGRGTVNFASIIIFFSSQLGSFHLKNT